MKDFRQIKEWKKMNFWIYENWQAANKTVIHKATCIYCNNGQGTGKEINKGQNGKWIGPFTSFNDAKLGAAKLKRKENLLCNVCNLSQDSN